MAISLMSRFPKPPAIFGQSLSLTPSPIMRLSWANNTIDSRSLSTQPTLRPETQVKQNRDLQVVGQNLAIEQGQPFANSNPSAPRGSIIDVIV